MARKPKSQLLSNDAREAIEAEMESIKLQLAKMDQAECIGVDCQAYRALAHYLYGRFETIINVAFKGQQPTPELIAEGQSAVQPPVPMG